MADEGTNDFGMSFPFTIVRSQGGPHDDLSFCSGWRLGALHTILRLTKVHGFQGEDGLIPMMLSCDELEQADLVAMEAGYTMTHTPVWRRGDGPNHYWHECRFALTSTDLTIPT